MHKIQVQLPDPLHRRLRVLSDELDYSIAELIRKGVEQIINRYPHIGAEDGGAKARWQLPKPINLGMKKIKPDELKQFAYSKE
jgi:hypothetical protein